ncbi:MAG: glycosyltransferase family 2 protein [Gemmatimonadota bacterium]
MRVSIIAPVYNAEKYIERCIRSVLSQTNEDWELLIVDDGSTDRTPEIIRQFNDERIRYTALPHRGIAKLAETYNTALREARGDLVAILEGDDEWPPDKLALQVPAFDEDDVVLSWGRGMKIDENNRPSRYWPVPRAYRRDLPMDELFRVLARWNVLSPAVTVMLRKSALTTIGGFQMTGSSLFVDLPTWLMVAATSPGRTRYLDENLGLYRTHSTNTGLLHNSKMRLEHNAVFTAIQTRLGPEKMAALGWTSADTRRTAASASLSHGVAALQDGDRRAARAAFRAALRGTRSASEFVNAIAGYVSALIGVDLIGMAIRLRYGHGPRWR